jgi:hypothetical protein
MSAGKVQAPNPGAKGAPAAQRFQFETGATFELTISRVLPRSVSPPRSDFDPKFLFAVGDVRVLTATAADAASLPAFYASVGDARLSIEYDHERHDGQQQAGIIEGLCLRRFEGRFARVSWTHSAMTLIGSWLFVNDTPLLCFVREADRWTVKLRKQSAASA